MTLNQVIALFRGIQEDHYQLNGFGFGNLFEINGQIKPGLKYPLYWAVPLDSMQTENTRQRRFLFLCLDLVKADKSNRDEVWSDMEQALDDVIKALKRDSDYYEVIGDPIKDPIEEEQGDWVAGWQSEVVLQTGFNTEACNIPRARVSSAPKNIGT